MTEQVPSDTVRENELICEKLLGWERRSDGPSFLENYWRCATGGDRLTTPSFTTWAEAGLILVALQCRAVEAVEEGGPNWAARVLSSLGIWTLSPLAIRAAALEYIRSLS